MDYEIAAQTDVGTVKRTNQDSIMIKRIFTNLGNMVFAVLCDGMGGLAKGELASATGIRAFDKWVNDDLQMICQNGPGYIEDSVIRAQWESIVANQNQKIKQYGAGQGVNLGTTVVALLVTDKRYYLMNVGDSRAYLVNDKLIQLARDQTFVGREIELGHMTIEQAKQNHTEMCFYSVWVLLRLLILTCFLEMCKVVRSFCFVRMVSDTRLHLMRFIRQSDHHL